MELLLTHTKSLRNSEKALPLDELIRKSATSSPRKAWAGPGGIVLQPEHSWF